MLWETEFWQNTVISHGCQQKLIKNWTWWGTHLYLMRWELISIPSLRCSEQRIVLPGDASWKRLCSSSMPPDDDDDDDTGSPKMIDNFVWLIQTLLVSDYSMPHWIWFVSDEPCSQLANLLFFCGQFWLAQVLRKRHNRLDDKLFETLGVLKVNQHYWW